MKTLFTIFTVTFLLLSVHLNAADNLDVDIYAGKVNLLSYEGSQAGLRISWPLKNWARFGFDISSNIHLQRELPDGRLRKCSFLRTHAIVKFVTKFSKFEPYIIGSIGKDVIGENPQAYSPPPLEPVQWFDSQFGAAWKAGIFFHLSKFRIGAEIGGGTTGTGFDDYNLLLGLRL